MNIQEMMKQAQVMQEKMKRMQDDLSGMEVTGESGGGMVKVTMSCKGEVRNIDISKDVISPDDKETLEDLIVAALNVAKGNADGTLASETQRVMQELGLPANMDIPGF